MDSKRENCGRHEKLSRDDKSKIIKAVLSNRFLTADEIAIDD